MPRSIPAYTAIALLASNLAMANDFHAEISANYTRGKTTYTSSTGDFSYNDKSSLLGGRYYLTSVETAGKPLAEAAFLGKNSSISATYYDYRSKIDYGSGDSFDNNGSSNSIGAFIYVPSTILVLGASYSSSSGQRDHSTQYTLGVTPVEGLMVYTSFWGDSEIRRNNINAKYVMPFDNGAAVNMEMGFRKGKDDEKNNYSLSGDYYFNRYYSLGLATGWGDGTSYGIKSTCFVTEAVSLFGALYTAKSDFPGLDASGKTWVIGASIRF
jgi:Putative general bacterial porin